MLIQTFGAVLFAALVGAAPQHQLEARTHGVSVEKYDCVNLCHYSCFGTNLKQCLDCLSACKNLNNAG
ncbi:hypothetical protein E4U23_006251 [Claviceps purpurea]|nr:hypothetical protein E4U23_006251 [Claviceps purpurea]